MTQQIILTEKQWALIKAELYLRYNRSVVDIRYRSKEVLGFTTRESMAPLGGDTTKRTNYFDRIRIHLDFYDDLKRTMFLLQFSEFLKYEILEQK